MADQPDVSRHALELTAAGHELDDAARVMAVVSPDTSRVLAHTASLLRVLATEAHVSWWVRSHALRLARSVLEATGRRPVEAACTPAEVGASHPSATTPDPSTERSAGY